MLRQRTFKFRLVVIGSLIVSSPAWAIFHFWEINEVYSNADGTIQYLELFTAFASQQFTINHTIRASQGASFNDFVFPSNTSAPTNNHHLLLATAGFSGLAGAVTPDFILPDCFLFRPNGTVDFIGANTITYASLPTDGVMSLHCVTNNGISCTSTNMAANTPTNYAGQVGSINASVACTDNDCDGFGSPGDASCAMGSTQDCDDTDPAISPGALEIPDDGIDQDCNGFDTVTCFVDTDGDGFGSTATLLASDGDCLDLGESTVDTDCNDANGSINPGASEVCDDSIDNNCNALTDCNDAACVAAPACLPSAPAVSEWGLALMTLLLVTSCTLVLRRVPKRG